MAMPNVSLPTETVKRAVPREGAAVRLLDPENPIAQHLAPAPLAPGRESKERGRLAKRQKDGSGEAAGNTAQAPGEIAAEAKPVAKVSRAKSPAKRAKAQSSAPPPPSAEASEERDSDDDGSGNDDAEPAVDAAAEIVDETESDENPVTEDDEGFAPRRVTATEDGIESSRASASKLAVGRQDPLQAYLREVQRHSLLTPDEEHSLATKYATTQDVAAAARLVTANLRLVVKIAYEYRRAYKNIMDLIQEGNIGLMQAVKKYDPNRGVKLSSYSAWWIRAYILRYIINNWRLVKLGTTQAQRKLFFNLNKEKAKLAAMGIDPTPGEIAKRLGVEEQEAIDMDRRLSSGEMSLDAPVGDNEGRPVARIELLPSSVVGPDTIVADGELQDIVRGKLAEFRTTLKGKDVAIFDKRLLAEDPLTLQELGDEFGISRERVRQIEARLTMNLRGFLRAALGDAVGAALVVVRGGREQSGIEPLARAVHGARMTGTLFVVATPIGNLGDLTRRAEDTLRKASRILAEDTRRTRGLLSSLGISGIPVDRFDAHATPHDVGRIVSFLEQGESIALVTDAGTPSVSDPGSALVRAASDAAITIVPIPGASAVVTALAGAGFAETAFLFLGFLPRGGRAREDVLARIVATVEIVVLFEAGNRLTETLRDLATLMPERQAMVGRELTKAHEELVRGTISELATREEWLGEITLVLGPTTALAAESASDEQLDAWLDEQLAEGRSARDAAAIVAARSGKPKREIYARAVARSRS